MFPRIAALFVFVCVASSTASAQYRPAQGYPPNAAAQPYPQQQFPQQPQPQPIQPVQPGPGAAQGAYPQEQGQTAPYYPQYAPQQPGQYAPGYGPPGGYPPGYGPPAEPLVSSVDGALQLSLGTSFVQYVSLSQSFDMGGDTSRSNLSWGFANNPVLLEGGYGITANMLVGGVLQLGGNSTSAEAGTITTDSSTFTFAIGPKFDYQFLPTSKLNPFVGAVVTLNVNSQSRSAPIGTTTAEEKDSQLTFNLLLRGGLRYFMFDQLSIDPTLSFGAVLGSGSIDSNMTKLDYSLSGFQFALSVALTLWIK